MRTGASWNLGSLRKQAGHIDPAVLDAVRAGTPLLAIPQADAL